MIQPVNGKITSLINLRCPSTSDSHAGIDIAGNRDQSIIAAYAGKVTARRVNHAQLGHSVTLSHAGGYTTMYAHMKNAPSVRNGQVVSQGQILGYVGSTGTSTGPHLHFEVKRKGVNVGGSLGYRCGQRVTQGAAIPYAFPGLPAQSPGGVDYTSDGNSDLLGVHTDGTLLLYPGNGAGGFRKRIEVGPGWASTTTIVHGDFNGDGRGDAIAVRADGRLGFYAGDGTGGFARRVDVGSGWNGMSLITGGADFDGDGNADLVAREDSTNILFLYPGRGDGSFGTRKKIGPGWGNIRLLTAGYYTSGGKADLLAVTTTGNLVLYAGNNNGSYTRREVGPGWNRIKSIVGGKDITGDGNTDLLATDDQGTLLLYAGKGNGTFAKSVAIGPGWNKIRLIG